MSDSNQNTLTTIQEENIIQAYDIDPKVFAALPMTAKTSLWAAIGVDDHMIIAAHDMRNSCESAYNILLNYHDASAWERDECRRNLARVLRGLEQYEGD